jgi:malate dehydrogenase (oxaloacetate-decarboxylating)(NADP+)
MTTPPSKNSKEALWAAALDYHRYPEPGKIAIKPTTPLATQRDLALAYSPGVAAPCEEIEKDPLKAYDYTSKGNLVAVITNGTAVLGLGNIGPLAAKPVMEGKSVLFKKFSNIDSVDLEINELDVDKFVDIVASLEPTYGGINLEDIKAPECFEIERKLKERMNIPVFHDDQHGTAIIVTAAFKNWLKFSGRDISKIKLVANGAGAASIACLNLLVGAGLKKENIVVCDREGVVHDGRTDLDSEKIKFARKTNMRTLDDAMKDADVFIGLSAAGAVSKPMVKSMGKNPLIMTLANPIPEIMPEEVREVRNDAIICTGRSDYTNQVNNVLCFPFIFRGALDCGATTINEEMKLACVEAIANLARKEVSAEVSAVYAGENLEFGAEYLIPKPFDPRLIVDLPIAVAKAAMASGVATRPIADFEAYEQRLRGFYIRSQLIMRPIYARAKEAPKRVVYCEGEEQRVLEAVQMALDEKIIKPILIGREKVVEARIKRLGLRMRKDIDFDLVDPEDDPRYRDYCDHYHQIMERRGVTPDVAKTILRTNTTVIGAIMVRRGDADSMICGTVGRYKEHVKHVIDIIGLKPGVETPAAMNALLVAKGTYFFCDTQINPDPSIAQISEVTLMATEEIKRFGLKPKVALLSHSNFGTADTDSARKMRSALQDLRRRDPELEIDGEMHADAALSEKVRASVMPNSTLKGDANLFIFPNVDAANIAFNMVKIFGEGISIGPLLLGMAKPVHVVTPYISARGIVNVTAIANVGAQVLEEEITAEKASATPAKKAKRA